MAQSMKTLVTLESFMAQGDVRVQNQDDEDASTLGYVQHVIGLLAGWLEDWWPADRAAGLKQSATVHSWTRCVTCTGKE